MTHTEAKELASQFGSRMCDENGDTHGEELYCVSLDDIIAIKEALAQPEQEPVAVHQFRSMYSAVWEDGHPDPKDGYGPYKTRTLYTAPPQRPWVGLTDEDYRELNLAMGTAWCPYRNYGQAIEAKLKEKNT